MKRTIMMALTFVLMVITPALGEEKPNLVRGEDFIIKPAIGEELCVHNIFQSGMVLQRSKPVPIWGWAAPGESVTVTFGGQTQTAKAAEDRSWKVTLTAMEANAKPQVLTVKGANKTLTLENILVGDLWVLGGQSNMAFPIKNLVNGQLEIVSANFPEIRHIKIPQLIGPELKKSFPIFYQWSNWSGRHNKQGNWQVCTPETVTDLSGMGYVFARRIHMATKVPIGVINTSRGGTTVETWTPLAELRKIDAPETKAWLAEVDEKVAEFDPQKDLAMRVEKNRKWVADQDKAKRKVPDSRRKAPTDLRKGPIGSSGSPGNCYAGVIAPLTGLPVKGAIFHQGYNNCFQGTRGSKIYYQVFATMIKAWREAFNDPAMPFGIISLCTAGEPQDQTNYLRCMLDIGAEIREAQYKTYLDLKKAGDEQIGFASSFDQRRKSYHPQIKIPVGERIAKWALATQYEMKLNWEPPHVTEMKVEDGRIVLKMNTNVGPHNDGPIHGFAIAGEDRKFQMAKAEYLVVGKDNRGRPRTDRKAIVLTSPMVPKPVHYRHAWSRNPMTNLRADTIPFATQRSDSWTQEDLYEAYMGQKPKAAVIDRGEKGQLSRALEAADLERRLFEARALLEEHKQDKK